MGEEREHLLATRLGRLQKYPTQVDKLLAGKPELRKRLEALAADPGSSCRSVMAAMNAAGVPARRGSVNNWMAKFRTVRRGRGEQSLAARVCAAVCKLGRGRLYQIAEELGVPVHPEETE